MVLEVLGVWVAETFVLGNRGVRREIWGSDFWGTDENSHIMVF